MATTRTRKKKTPVAPVAIAPPSAPVETVRTKLNPQVLGTESSLLWNYMTGLVVGQPEACREVVHVYQQFLTGLSVSGRPVATFLLLGPTGTGKTRTVEALAESLSGTAAAVLRIDCAEYQHSHEIAKLIGSPPGYLGHRETHPLLSQEQVDRYKQFGCPLGLVLFDEIEKASDSLWNLLLGILDKATLTLGDNRKVDFSNTMVFLTSNLGTEALNDLIAKKMGFAPPSGFDDMSAAQRRKDTAINAARKRFSSELFNRLDKVITYNPLSDEDLNAILDIELQAVGGRLIRASGGRAMRFHLDSGAKNFLLSKGTDRRYNARHLKRSVEVYLTRSLAAMIATGQASLDEVVEVTREEGEEGLSFFKEVQKPVERSITEPAEDKPKAA